LKIERWLHYKGDLKVKCICEHCHNKKLTAIAMMINVHKGQMIAHYIMLVLPSHQSLYNVQFPIWPPYYYWLFTSTRYVAALCCNYCRHLAL